MVLYAANWTHDKPWQTEARKETKQPSPSCIYAQSIPKLLSWKSDYRHKTERWRKEGLRTSRRKCLCCTQGCSSVAKTHLVLFPSWARATSSLRHQAAVYLAPSSKLEAASEMAGHDLRFALRVNFGWKNTRRHQKTTIWNFRTLWGYCTLANNVQTFKKCCSPWMRLSLSSVAGCWIKSLSLSDSCLAKSSALAAKVEKMWLVERPGIEDEKKLQSCSTSSASDGAIFHGAISESISRTSKILRRCGHLWSSGSCYRSSGSCYRSSGSCFSCGMSTSPSLYLHMFWHMTHSPSKLGLTNSRCFAHWQHKT